MLIPFKVYDAELDLIDKVFCFDDVSPDELKISLVVEEDYPADIIVMRG